jgi:hypothetical protein
LVSPTQDSSDSCCQTPILGLIIVNGNQDSGNSSFLFFLTVRTYLTFLFDTNFTGYSLVHKDLKFVGTSRLPAMVFKTKASTFYYF